MKYPYSKKRLYQKGEIIINQGETSDDMYIMRRGLAEIVEVNPEGNETLIGVVDKGQVFGEMGFILEQPSSITVRALEEVEVDIFDTRSFSELYETDLGQFMRPIMQKLAERLRSAESKMAELETHHQDEDYYIDDATQAGNVRHQPEGKSVMLVAETSEAVQAMGGLKSIEITSFPFDVGRFSRRRSDDMFHFNNFYLHDYPPYVISRSHFSIVAKNKGFYFRDRGSMLGSVVNGIQVGGGHFRTKKILLKHGENTLQLGEAEKNLLFTLGVI